MRVALRFRSYVCCYLYDIFLVKGYTMIYDKGVCGPFNHCNVNRVMSRNQCENDCTNQGSCVGYAFYDGRFGRGNYCDLYIKNPEVSMKSCPNNYQLRSNKQYATSSMDLIGTSTGSYTTIAWKCFRKDEGDK